MFGADHPARRVGRWPASRAGAWGDRADAFLDQCPCRFDRIQVVRIRRQKLEGGAALLISWRTRASLCAPRLSMITMSPARSFGAKRRSTHPTNRSAFAACQSVLSVSQRSARIAPISVKLFPQFISRTVNHDLTVTQSIQRPVQGAHRIINKRECWDLSERSTGGTPRVWLEHRRSVLQAAAVWNTYPLRCRARRILDRWTRRARSTRRLYLPGSAPRSWRRACHGPPSRVARGPRAMSGRRSWPAAPRCPFCDDGGSSEGASGIQREPLGHRRVRPFA